MIADVCIVNCQAGVTDDFTGVIGQLCSGNLRTGCTGVQDFPLSIIQCCCGDIEIVSVGLNDAGSVVQRNSLDTHRVAARAKQNTLLVIQAVRGELHGGSAFYLPTAVIHIPQRTDKQIIEAADNAGGVIQLGRRQRQHTVSVEFATDISKDVGR